MNTPPCNSCGGELQGPNESNQPMSEPGSMWFQCSSCDQNITIMPSGRSLQTILPALYPEKMSPAMNHEFADHEGGQKVFFSALGVVAGHRTEAEHEEFAAKVADAVERYKAEHPLPTTLRERIRAVFA